MVSSFFSIRRPHIVSRIREAYADVLAEGSWPSLGKLPLVYSPRYNITFFGIEKVGVRCTEEASHEVPRNLYMHSPYMHSHAKDTRRMTASAIAIEDNVSHSQS
jgi:hypothetical protein